MVCKQSLHRHLLSVLRCFEGLFELVKLFNPTSWRIAFIHHHSSHNSQPCLFLLFFFAFLFGAWDNCVLEQAYKCKLSKLNRSRFPDLQKDTSHNDANHAATVLTLMSKRHALLLLVWIVLKAGGVSEMRLQFNNDESSANALASH